MLLYSALTLGVPSSKVPTSHQVPGSRVLGRTPPNAIPDRCKRRSFLELFPFFQVTVAYKRKLHAVFNIAMDFSARMPLSVTDLKRWLFSSSFPDSPTKGLL